MRYMQTSYELNSKHVGKLHKILNTIILIGLKKCKQCNYVGDLSIFCNVM